MAAALVLETSAFGRVGSSPTWGTNFYASVAHLDRAPGYEPGGGKFESFQTHHLFCTKFMKSCWLSIGGFGDEH